MEVGKLQWPGRDGEFSDHLLEPGVTPSKFGQPLRIVPDHEVGTRPHLQIVKFELNGSPREVVRSPSCRDPPVTVQ